MAALWAVSWLCRWMRSLLERASWADHYPYVVWGKIQVQMNADDADLKDLHEL